MKLLPAPYGWPSGVPISMKTCGVFNPAKVQYILEQYSCYPPSIPRILNALKYSGRYDCRVQATWFNRQKYELAKSLKELNVELSIQDEQCTGVQ